MRSLLCRFWLLAPLLLLFAQGCGGLRADGGTLGEATTSYLPAEASGSERRAVEEDATVESDDDDDDAKKKKKDKERAKKPTASGPVRPVQFDIRRSLIFAGIGAALTGLLLLPIVKRASSLRKRGMQASELLQQADQALLEERKEEIGYFRLICDSKVAKISVVGVGMKSHAGVAATTVYWTWAFEFWVGGGP